MTPCICYLSLFELDEKCSCFVSSTCLYISCRPMPRYLQAHCRYIESSALHCQCLTVICSFQYSIISIEGSTPKALAAAKLYYSSIDFAFQLCRELAAAERSNAELSQALEHASKMLERIVAHNVLLKSSDPQPAWPRHKALLRFDLPLQRFTTHNFFTKKWILRFFVLRGSRLYYSNGKSGHSDTLEGSLAFMRSNPAPDGHCCLDLKGACACCATAAFCCASQLLDTGCTIAPCSAAVDGQAFAFLIKFPADREVNPRFFSMCLNMCARITACCRARRTCTLLLPTM